MINLWKDISFSKGYFKLDLANANKITRDEFSRK